MASAAVTARPREAAQLNPEALEFISSRSGSESGSPVRCSSPISTQGGSPRAMQAEGQAIGELTLEAGGTGRRAGGAGSGVGDVIPAPAPRLSRRSSSSSLHSGAASPPLPVSVMAHPGMMPAYGWAAPPAYPVYHPHPHPAVFHPGPGAPPPHDGPVERAASPPSVFPNGGSPPLPTGFISVPLQAMSNPGSPTSRHMYGASPPHHHSPFGASPPYGSSPPPGMAGSPPGMGMMFMPPPMLHHAHSGEWPHGGFTMQQQQEFAQRMAGLSLSHGQQAAAAAAQQQGQQVPRAPGSSGSGRSEGRASARIARSHRAGGAYNPAEFEFDLAEAESGRPDARRTLMIRNIPNKYSQEMMLSVLQKSGFGGTFDFFYLPIDFRNKCNLGYCFVNFLDASVAGRLYRDFHQKRWEEYNSKKVCEVTYGRVQGRDSLVAHFRASKFPSDDIEFMPLVFTRNEAGLASNPVPIHQYLGALDSGALPAAPAEGGGSEQRAAEVDSGAAAEEEQKGSTAVSEA
ncbi:hypothetical protein ABPG75_009918 [Micractinium tetrahymenae]